MRGVFLWGEVDMLWTEGLVEFLRWRRQRKKVAADARRLVAEAERFLAAQRPAIRPGQVWPPMKGPLQP